ncbi:ABC transporter permease [Enterococcus hulanensis]|uniref:Transport permease protein n=1 Tax=Enterococcus hulanensis TaxID=2559929 RepID=A0ABU3EZ71_9ENTE|nr:ABC transporter permease [Enterococcus hulanensis]MDT2600177.1 ABC transporter permease [Enterococcus hulanensis]MDT2608990.1 ABC transporter permease [Enterococcus hulanensis]MDT2616968.1 ABC transporter permease [Enterococcus hulanensis]MDT2628512.1 ABC transporter permease [Enterococcus hulanensis]MDT2655852.1 ABC transporter permease [Enterococcus hulanensis]
MTVFSDTMTLTGRMMKHMTRSVDTIMTVVLMPIMLMLAFIYIFGGAMTIPQEVYKGFIVPAILLFTVASGVGYTAFRLNGDIQNGIFERFHSMPIAKSAILNSHVVTSVVFNFISAMVVLLSSILIGFRPKADVLDWVMALLLLLAATYALSWIAVLFGLIAKNTETAIAFSYLLIGLLFISSGFVPTETLPKILRGFADYQPMTPIINTLRSILTDGVMPSDIWLAFTWCIGAIVIFQVLSIYVYRKKLR